MASVYNNSDVTASASYKFAAGNRYVADLDKNVYTVSKDGVPLYSYTHPVSSFQLVSPIELFRIRLATPRYGKFRLYSAKIYDNSNIVRDFIPVRCGTTGYMYDRVSGTLFGNDGTGDFIVGADV